MNLVIYTSLPDIGGHTTVTLKLVEFLRDRYTRVFVGVKDMPGHGRSDDAIRTLKALGCEIQCFDSGEWFGGLIRLFAWSRTVRREKNAVFICVGMRYLTFLLAAVFDWKLSAYYHITHDLSSSVARRLDWYRRLFSKLVFVCPATCEAYRNLRPNVRNIDWVIQGNRLDTESSKRRKTNASDCFRFGFSSRLNAAKGSELLVKFAEASTLACEIHVLGDGEYRSDFERLAARRDLPVRVFYHGTFLPAERGAFLAEFFRTIDCICVPSLDNVEGFPTVILEALQSGVPALATSVGGLKSYSLPVFGPADRDVVELVKTHDFSAALAARISLGKLTEERRSKCRVYYQTYFSDAMVRSKWQRLLELPDRAT